MDMLGRFKYRLRITGLVLGLMILGQAAFGQEEDVKEEDDPQELHNEIQKDLDSDKPDEHSADDPEIDKILDADIEEHLRREAETRPIPDSVTLKTVPKTPPKTPKPTAIPTKRPKIQDVPVILQVNTLTIKNNTLIINYEIPYDGMVLVRLLDPNGKEQWRNQFVNRKGPNAINRKLQALPAAEYTCSITYKGKTLEKNLRLTP